MSRDFVPFDKARNAIVETLARKGVPDGVDRLYLVRNMFGKVRISVSEKFETNSAACSALSALAGKIGEAAGRHGYGADETDVLFVPDDMLDTFDGSTPIAGVDRAHWVERLVTGGGWWTAGKQRPESKARRWTLFSVKGGVGRSTTCAVLAHRLADERQADKRQDVLIVDLDLESPGLSSAMLRREARPEFGVTDWFAEELVGQGGCVIERMTATPEWAADLEGDVRVAPAHGADPGEYLAKLGRVYMDSRDYSWTERLDHMLTELESAFKPTIILIESRSGLHDIAAATVTDIDADVLLFATDSDSCWADYDILFRHWRDRELASRIRDRLEMVSALTPAGDNEEQYLQRFKEHAWNLFRDHVYDSNDPSSAPDVSSEVFSFNIEDKEAPHTPLVIHWNEGLSAGSSLLNMKKPAINIAYGKFFERLYERIIPIDDGGEQ